MAQLLRVPIALIEDLSSVASPRSGSSQLFLQLQGIYFLLASMDT